MKLPKLIIPAIILIVVILFQSAFIVKEINQAIVLQFGNPKKIITEAGLKFKYQIAKSPRKPPPHLRSPHSSSGTHGDVNKKGKIDEVSN